MTEQQISGRIVQATNIGGGGINWGKFFVGRFSPSAWTVPMIEGSRPVLRARGWSHTHIWVLDLETGEGVCVRPGGSAHADLQKHKVWVCPLFEPFLEWLYKQDLTDLVRLPAIVELPGAESALHGYRRPGQRDE